MISKLKFGRFWNAFQDDTDNDLATWIVGALWVSYNNEFFLLDSIPGWSLHSPKTWNLAIMERWFWRCRCGNYSINVFCHALAFIALKSQKLRDWRMNILKYVVNPSKSTFCQKIWNSGTANLDILQGCKDIPHKHLWCSYHVFPGVYWKHGWRHLRLVGCKCQSTGGQWWDKGRESMRDLWFFACNCWSNMYSKIRSNTSIPKSDMRRYYPSYTLSFGGHSLQRLRGDKSRDHETKVVWQLRCNLWPLSCI